MNFTLRARTTAEFVGTAFLLAAVVGSGIMGEQLAAGTLQCTAGARWQWAQSS
jgi:glycerol uptake facilitator-like aquaporin